MPSTRHGALHVPAGCCSAHSRDHSSEGEERHAPHAGTGRKRRAPYAALAAPPSARDGARKRRKTKVLDGGTWCCESVVHAQTLAAWHAGEYAGVYLDLCNLEAALDLNPKTGHDLIQHGCRHAQVPAVLRGLH